jgi:putative SOS response-associated peptidase YedK
MSGRFSLTSISSAIQNLYGEQLGLPFEPRYNISPGQQILVVKSDGCTPAIEPMHWGLIPHWSKDRTSSYKMINARGETITEKPSFRSAYRERRCLIPANNYFEWKREGRTKQPYTFQQIDREPFSFGGIWETWVDESTGVAIKSCSIITTETNSLVAPIHNRMPVIIQPQHYAEWLHGNSRKQLHLLQPYEWPFFECFAVSSYVNNASHEGPECIEPVPEIMSLF